MLLDRLVLHNFAQYAGKQTIELTPPSPDKPVVLFGGLNGAGKTTLLDAFQLALYGKRAQCSNRGAQSYADFLRACIHRGVAPEMGAAVTLVFRHRSDGIEHEYSVRRSWEVRASAVPEHLEVLKDGVLHKFLTSSWDEQVDQFMPQCIAHLFFFDGDKIESWAQLDKASELLENALQSLLGLELVEQLGVDLVALERKKKVSKKSAEERSKIEALQKQLSALEKASKLAEQELVVANEEATLARKVLEKLEQKLRKQGGDLFAQRGQLEGKKDAVDAQLKELNELLVDLAAGAAPLLLLSDDLQLLHDHARAEVTSATNRAVVSLLEGRDKRLVELIRSHIENDELVELVRSELCDDRRKRTAESEGTSLLERPEALLRSLSSLQDETFEQVTQRLQRSLQQRIMLEEEQVVLERLIAAAPDQEAIATLLLRRSQAKAQLEAVLRVVELKEDECERRAREFEPVNATLCRELDKAVQADFEREDVGRVIRHSERARDTLQVFKKRVISMNIERIERLVLESFQRLLRKKELIAQLRIDPIDLNIKLYDSESREVPATRLSAGERQLLAVSILWGLAQASGRPLPTVIDTPLGRLDSQHRGHLVESYFPWAGEQVLLLSTDEEINGAYLDRLKPWIGRSYHLVYDESTAATTVEPGYFQ